MTGENASGLLPNAQIEGRFVRSMIQDIEQFVLPAVTSGDAQERAYFMMLVLARIADNDDMIPAAFPDVANAFEAAAASAIETIRQHDPDADAIQRLREIDTAEARHAPAHLRIIMLRAVLGEAVRTLSAITAASPAFAAARTQLEIIVALEHDWLAAKAAHQPVPPKAEAAPQSVYDRVTTATVTAYLRVHFPRSPDIAASAVEVLAGGRSKKTIFISITGTDELPSIVVMRQDTGMVHIGTSLLQEHPLLASVSRTGLPIPAIYHFEPEWTALGGPFMLMQRLPGKPTGSYPAFDNATPALVIEIARSLAAIHAVDPVAIGLPGADATVSQGDHLRQLVQKAWSQWREEAIEPSPLIEYAFDWMLRQCNRPLAGNRIVHGDYRPHNFLAEDDRLTGILDWEFAHIGDHAEDLAYIRPVILPIMPWEDFLRHYQDAGGTPCDEATLVLYEIWGLLRLAAMGAGAVRQFMDGRSDDFTQGAGGFFIMPPFEQQLSDLIKRANDIARHTI